MRLTLAIPVHNDRDNLIALLRTVGRLGFADRVVVVDDGSDIPLDADALCAAAALPRAMVQLLRHDTSTGPGVARNRALSEVETDHLLYLDSDDLPTRDLAPLLRDLTDQAFDFCLFQHHDTRMDQELAWGQMPWDQTHWHRAGVALGALNPVNPAAAAHLAHTANYPWNKIYRTAFLRDNAIGCSDIRLHEDIELHWRSFLAARHILASDRIGVVHVFHPHGTRMTNRTDHERLAVFGPLQRIAGELESDTGKNRVYAGSFFAFTLGLFDWICNNLHREHQAQFARLVQEFQTTHIPPEMLERLTRTDPNLIKRLKRHLPPDQTGG